MAKRQNVLLFLLSAMFSAILVLSGCTECGVSEQVGSVVASEEESSSLLPPELVKADGSAVETSSLGNKLVGLYFSAAWCPPCRAFTPELVKFRDRNAAEFEVVLVSSDRSESDMFEYMRTYNMTWLAVPYDSAFRASLSRKFGVRGIPALIVVDSKGNVISRDGRGEVSSKPNALEEWKAKAR